MILDCGFWNVEWGLRQPVSGFGNLVLMENRKNRISCPYFSKNFDESSSLRGACECKENSSG
jgi:hypothetical protein